MKRAFSLLMILLLGAGAAGAQEGTAAATPSRGRPPLGIRAGYTHWSDLNQFHLGGHVKLGDIFRNVAFTPGFELGFGDGATLFTVNGDVVYRATEMVDAPWGLYLGGGLSLIYVDANAGGSDTDLGLAGLVGVTRALSNGNEVMAELRIGLIDSPDFKLTCGYTFF